MATQMKRRKFWIAVASYNHVKVGIEGGFAQVCHGKKTPLLRLSENDVIFYYSPTIEMGSKAKYQHFSAIGRVLDDNVYSYRMSDSFEPFRRNVSFHTNIKHASIHPLIPQLEFIVDPKRYGSKFRYGLFEISHHDALVIWNALKI